MFLDFGWSEMLLIGVVALVFIGPKDLPKALRVAGFWVRKARSLSREFQSSIDQMIREAELDDIRRDLKKATELDLDKEFQEAVDPTGSLAESLRPPELPDFTKPEQPVEPAAEGTAAPSAVIEAAPAEIEASDQAKREAAAALDIVSPDAKPEVVKAETSKPAEPVAAPAVAPRAGEACEYAPPKL